MALAPTDLLLQLQHNLSDDFHRKIREWDRMHATCSPQWDRASRRKEGKIQDLSWLEKELQKVEQEKQRLSKERLQYELRALRLEKLKETVLGRKRDVLVRTSAGEFRFEGISDAFTQKLYEWETKRGVDMEYSTIALLNSSRLVGPTMQRMLSKSESSLADIGAGAANSLPPDAERQNHLSKADSEPDLSTLTANLSVAIHEAHDATVPYGEGNVEERKGSETYYSLLEENVLLLERLKEKEEICRRLERDLEILDEKMEEMNDHHSKETQRYREKLWELHRQGESPREVLCCRRTMDQLRERIEALERWTRKLRSERDNVQVHFRHHSKEQESMTLDLLERMRELQTVGSSTTDADSRALDAGTLDRLRDLSAQLRKQTGDLQEALVRKTGQIRQLKWELLHRDLSTVKLETERHSHSAEKKRSKYTQWRSRSSEEPAAPQKMGVVEIVGSPPDAFCLSSSVEEFQTTDLAHTVQQLNEEVQKLTSTASLTKCCPEEKISQKHLERGHQSSSNPPVSKKITVRRNSADNSSLLSTDDSRLRGGHTSSHSDDSSDEYYSRVSYNAGVTHSSTAERLLMSYGENPPRTMRRKKLQKISKLNSNLGRRRSNTFHTNRDLQKPTIVEYVPQKCHSFRVPRENYNEASAIVKTPYFRRKVPTSNFTVPVQSDGNNEAKLFHGDFLCRSEADLKSYRDNLIREAASDSKIPLIMKVKKYSDTSSEKSNRKFPVRSMSDKTSREANTEKEYLQKRRSKKRVKAQNLLAKSTDDGTKDNLGESSQHHDSPPSNRSQDINPSQVVRDLSQKERGFSKTLETSQPEIPTITIQFPKRKHRKQLSIDETTDEQSVTIIVPKKRSLSSECDSSISESSPREELKKNNSPDSFMQKKALATCNTDPLLLSSNTKSEASIQLMRLVSLERFDNPFDQNKISSSKDHKQKELARKRKAHDQEFTNKSESTEEMIDMIKADQEESYDLTKSSTTGIEHSSSANAPSTTYIKSPSAPQLDWRKACAKKISRSGAPNVRTLIERYNQKVTESQTGKSPSSSNVSSPLSLRKISTPNSSSCPQQYVPHFCSNPNTPTTTPTLTFAYSHFPNSPPTSPSLVARSEALKKAKEQFIASPPLSTQNSPVLQRTDKTSRNMPQKSSYSTCTRPEGETYGTRSDEDRMSSHSSMDSMNLMMLRAGESCRESRLPKKLTTDSSAERHDLKASKSLSSSSLFKAVLHSDFKVPPNLLKLKRSRRKKDMSTVTELCRQSLLLSTEEAPNVLTPVSPKSCPSSPVLKPKTHKPNWLQRNIFRQK